MPRVAGGEERDEVVIIRKIRLVVVAEHARAVGIILIGYRSCRIEESRHSKVAIGKGGGRCPGAVAARERRVVMTFIPGGGEIFDAFRRLVKWLNFRSRMRVGKGNRGIEAVDCLRVSDTEWREARSTIGAELSEIHIERAVFLQHKEDVLDHARGQGIHGDRYRLCNRGPAARCRICGVGRGCSRSYSRGALGW